MSKSASIFTWVPRRETWLKTLHGAVHKVVHVHGFGVAFSQNFQKVPWYHLTNTLQLALAGSVSTVFKTLNLSGRRFYRALFHDARVGFLGGFAERPKDPPKGSFTWCTSELPRSSQQVSLLFFPFGDWTIANYPSMNFSRYCTSNTETTKYRNRGKVATRLSKSTHEAAFTYLEYYRVQPGFQKSIFRLVNGTFEHDIQIGGCKHL